MVRRVTARLQKLKNRRRNNVTFPTLLLLFSLTSAPTNYCTEYQQDKYDGEVAAISPAYEQLQPLKLVFVAAIRNTIRYEKEARWEMQCLNICSATNKMNLPATTGHNW